MKTKKIIGIALAVSAVGAFVFSRNRSNCASLSGKVEKISSDVCQSARSVKSFFQRFSRAANAFKNQWRQGNAPYPETTDRVDEEFSASLQGRNAEKKNPPTKTFPQHN